MFFEFTLDFAERGVGIEDHMDALPHPFENDFGLLRIQKAAFLLGHRTVSMTCA
jgi:hypothetical protein